MTAIIMKEDVDTGAKMYYTGTHVTDQLNDAITLDDSEAVRKVDQLNMLGYNGGNWIADSID